MLNVEEKGNVVTVEHPPHGRTAFNKDFLAGLKKEDFEKKYNPLKMFDVQAMWKAIRPYTKVKKK